MSNQLFKKLLLLITFSLCLLFVLLRIDHLAGYIGLLFQTIQPFLIGCLTAFLINIPMRWLERALFSRLSPASRLQRFKRALSLLLTVMIAVLLVFSVFKLVIPALADTVSKIAASVPGAIKQFNSWLLTHGIDTTAIQEELIKRLPTAAKDLDLEHISGLAVDYAAQILSTTTDLVSLTVSRAADLAIAVCFSIYLLFSKETLSRQLKKLIYAYLPHRICDALVSVGQLCVDTFCSFFSGQFLEACILGSLFFVTLTVIRMPYTLLISVFIAMTAMIPVFGAFIGCAVGALLIVMVDPLKAVIFVITFLILQQIEGNLIYPHVVGGRVGLPSIWVLVAVTVGGSLMGLLGMLLFIPAFSVVYKIIRFDALNRLQQRDVSPGKWKPKPAEPPKTPAPIVFLRKRLTKKPAAGKKK